MGVCKNCVAVNKRRSSATACAPLCGLAGVQKVTSHLSLQTQVCQKRVAGVRHPVSPAPPKVADKPGGRKVCRIKAGGRFGAPGQRTPPRRAGRGFSVGGRKSKGQRENRLIPAAREVAVTGGFRGFQRGLARGSFFTPWGQAGGLFQLSPYSRRILSGSRRGYVQGSAPTTSRYLRGQNAEQQAAAQHEVRIRIVRSSASPSVATQSSAQKSQPTDP